MQVETYEEEEILSQTAEENKQAQQLRIDLGMATLEDQMVYRRWTDDEQFIYSTLLTHHVNLTEYEGAVPLRVLQVAAHARAMRVFRTFQVWESSSSNMDPVLLAQHEQDPSYSGRWYLLARWGDMLQPLEDLLPLAIRAAGQRALALATEEKAHVEAKIAALTSGDLSRIRAAL